VTTNIPTICAIATAPGRGGVGIVRVSGPLAFDIGQIILDLILNRFLSLGAILAKPGEFSERAFLNDKLDLTQAEAIADLIEASSVQAAQNAVQTPLNRVPYYRKA